MEAGEAAWHGLFRRPSVRIDSAMARPYRIDQQPTFRHYPRYSHNKL
jgi:hypothetical protein